MNKKMLKWAILIVGAVVVYSWWKSKKVVTAAPPQALNSAGTGTSEPSLSLTQVGQIDQFLGGLPGLNIFGTGGA